MSDIEFDDPEAATEELRNAATTPSEEDTPDANVQKELMRQYHQLGINLWAWETQRLST